MVPGGVQGPNRNKFAGFIRPRLCCMYIHAPSLVAAFGKPPPGLRPNRFQRRPLPSTQPYLKGLGRVWNVVLSPKHPQPLLILSIIYSFHHLNSDIRLNRSPKTSNVQTPKHPNIHTSSTSYFACRARPCALTKRPSKPNLKID